MPAAERPRVLIAGGGVAALEGVLALRELAGDRLALTLLSARREFEYGPLSVAEPFGLGRAHRLRLADLLAGSDVELVFETLVGVGEGEARAQSGARLAFDALLLAIGAGRRGALPGAVTFSGPRAAAEVRRLLEEAETGRLRRLCFAVPAGITWSLPIYELALMSAAHLEGSGAAVSVASPESRPVEAFGEGAGAAVAELLRLRGVEFRSGVPLGVEPGRLLIEGGDHLPTDAVIALPRLHPPRIAGVPGGGDDFVPVDEHCRVPGREGLYAAGDATTFELKQGGIAAQQADAAAEAIAADLGLGPTPSPFRPRLSGLLLAGPAPRHLRLEVVRGAAGGGDGSVRPARWPPVKIAGRRLGPLLARHGAFGGAPPGALSLQLEAPPLRPASPQGEGT